jgi:arylsulfatase A-like enzyme
VVAVAVVLGTWLYRHGSNRGALDKVILISIDTLRADHLGYAGYPRPTSPNIDRLATESINFSEAYCQAPSTLPSHASMFTSLYPSVHKAEISTARPLAEGFITLAESFKSAGFRTAAFVEGGQLETVWNLDQGFDLYDVTPFDKTPPGDDLTGILSKARAWIDTHRDERFFCFVHSYVVHTPYAPRPPYDRMFDEAYDGPLPFVIEEGDELDRINENPRWSYEPDVRHVISLYDGEIRYMDEHLGAFLKHLEELGIADQTVVVFTSDHGEELGDHGWVGKHAHSLYDELLHVPLLIRIPGTEPRRIWTQVRLIDLAPTILGIMGLDRGEAPFQGVDLLADKRGPRADLPVYSEQDYSWGFWASLRIDGVKIIAEPDNEYKVLDLDNDPRELRNLYRLKPEAYADRVRLIRDWISDCAASAGLMAEPVELTPDVKQQLRALGYLE